jgi:glycopeptide antibiotics resistance protein
MRQRLTMRLGAVAVTVVAISILAVMALPAALTPAGRPVEQESASQIATDYLVDGLESGTQVLETHVTDVRRFSGAWRVWIDASVRYPGESSSQPTPVHLVIDVDMSTGTPRPLRVGIAEKYVYTLSQFVIGPLFSAVVGAIVVALVWTILTLFRARRGDLRGAVLTSLPEAIGVMGVAAILPFALGPNPGVETTINLVPLKGLASNLFSSNWPIALANATGNIALFIPVGVALRWRFAVGWARAAVLGAGLSLTVELLQLLANNGRSVDVDDVVVNIAGTMLGVGLVRTLLEAKWIASARPD